MPAPTVTLSVPGLQQPFRALHITDSHIPLVDEADTDLNRLQKSRKRRDDLQGDIELHLRFERILQEVAPEFDLLLLTGDIIDSPSHASLDWAASRLRATGLPWIYIPGNHDWHFWSDIPTPALRAQNYPRLAPLFGSTAPAPFHRTEFNGVQFLALDDSTYQVDQDQLEFTRAHLATGQPTVILVHIPLLQDALKPLVVERWGTPIVLGAAMTPQEEKRWFKAPDDPATPALLNLLKDSPNVLAVLSGHVHFAHEEAHGRTTQYVGAPGFESSYRAVHFVAAAD